MTTDNVKRILYPMKVCEAQDFINKGFEMTNEFDE